MRTYISLLAVLVTVATAEGQFKDILKKAKKQVEDSLQPPKTASAKQGASPSPHTVAQSTGKPQQPAELWPNIAVDEEVVNKQKEVLRQDCLARKNSGSTALDCDCIIKQFPDFRLKELSRHIRDAEIDQKYGCERDPENCGVYRAQFEWITSREAQINFPTAADRPKPSPGPRKFQPPSKFDRHVLTLVYLALAKTCTDGTALGAQAEKNCQEYAASGMLNSLLKPGQSTKAYCACVKESVGAGSGESEALTKCRQK
ncbi:hypothetical protein [Paludibaculum fermentans]|uniref:hypothetical protein n=1 Tax=Paludibaculum fermentans TaxID=1473598 RepID=UPI003EBC974E